jgi:lysophospholipase L1-like esterase
MASLPLTRKLAFAAITTLVVFGGVELGLRSAGWPKPTGTFAHNEPFWITDPGLSSEAFPHNEERTTFPVSTDENGLRAPVHAVEKPPSAWRLLSMGCSTTFGWGVGDAEAYPAQLEAALRARGHAGAEVINGGQPGYTSFQGLWLWDEVLKNYEPDVVLIGFIVQDSRKAAYTDKSQAVLQQDARFLKQNLLYRSRLYMGLRAGLGSIQLQAKERPDGGEEGQFRVPPADYAENLRALVAKVQAAGATPVLLGYPLERSGYTAQHRLILQAAAEQLGVPHLDLQPQMERAVSGQQLYFPNDRGHANAAGNALIATWVADFIEAKGLTGAGAGTPGGGAP